MSELGIVRWLGRIGVGLVLLAVILGGWSLSAQAQEQSGISSPAAGSVVSGDVPIFGTAVIEPFQKYELHYKQEPSGDDAFIYFGGGTNQVINGQLGVWQAGGLPPGNYSLRLRVVKADGNYAEFYAPNLSVNLGESQGLIATPTSSEPTPSPIPTATFTPAPQPTAAVGAVQQPQVEGEQPVAAPPASAEVAAADANAQPAPASAEAATSEPVALGSTNLGSTEAASEDGGLTRELGQALAFEKLRTQFWNGVRYSAVLCLGILALFGGKRLFDWVWTQFR
jgi:hypothetical protein